MAPTPGEPRHAPVRLRRLMTLAVLIFACSSSTPTLAADPAPTPSGKNLRDAYPLHTEPSVTPRSVAGRPVRQSSPAPAPREDGGDITPVIALLAVTCALVAFMIVRRRRRDAAVIWLPIRMGKGGAQIRAPSPMASFAIFGTGLDARAQPRAPGSRGRFAGASPPDRAQAWTAEIVWRETDGESRFIVSGRSERDEDAVVLSSDPIVWPPRDAAEVTALERVVGELDATMQRAGWSELEPRQAWYARRFTWAPQKEKEEPAAAASSPASGDVQ